MDSKLERGFVDEHTVSMMTAKYLLFASLMFLLCLFDLTETALGFISRTDACDTAKKLGAGVLQWTVLTPGERLEMEQYKKDYSDEYNHCYEDGKHYGDIPWSDIEDRKMRERLSPDDYIDWKIEKEVDRQIDRKIDAKFRQLRAEKKLALDH